MGCFSFEDLLAGCEAPELPEAIRQHVSGRACEVCARNLEVARRMLELLPSLALDTPPARALEAALGVPARARHSRALILDVVARPRTALAFRSDSAPGTRRQLYRAAGFELDLARNEDGTLVGELIHGEGPGATPLEGECTLYGGESVAQTHLDSEGFFRFDAVGPGRHVLVIDSQEALLVVPELETPG